MGMKRNRNNKISFQDVEAIPYAEHVATSLLHQAKEMLGGLPAEMKESGKAVNERLENIFSEGNFAFALYVEKDDSRPSLLFLGISAIASFVPWSVQSFLACKTKEGLLEFLEKEYTVEKCTNDLLWCMQSLYESKKEL